PVVYARYLADVRHLDGVKHFIHGSDRYPLGSVGRLNTAPLFVELMWSSINRAGRVGVVTPTGIATDAFTQSFFRAMVDRRSLVSLFDFENRRGIFPGVDRRYKFSLLTLSGDDRPVDEAEFVFFALDVGDLADPERRFTLKPEDFALLNPNTGTCPVFRTRRDAEITEGIYRRVPVLVKDGDPNGNPWGFKGQLMFNMSADSHLFRTREELEAEGWTLQGNHFVRGEERYLPLYEGKMAHHFDHRWATFDGEDFREVSPVEKRDPAFTVMPRYWVPMGEVETRAPGRQWFCGWRDISRSTDERTFIGSVIPWSGAGHTFQLFRATSEQFVLSVIIQSSSFIQDFVARLKFGGTHATLTAVKQLPALHLNEGDIRF